jgi:hypothetical protein
MLDDRAAEEDQLRRALNYFTTKGSIAYVDWTNLLLDDFASRG